MGLPHTQTILMTNVSFSFNSFKLLPLHDSIKVTYHESNFLGLLLDPIHAFGQNVGGSVNDHHDNLYTPVEPRHRGCVAADVGDGSDQHSSDLHVQEGPRVPSEPGAGEG